MLRRMAAPHRSRNQGFTLVELLVVVVILGILSAVVVFAVRGSDDKGKAAAVATDERIIRTALETFCARENRYPGPDPMAELVQKKYLGSPSKYHTLGTGDALAAYPEGKCANTPMHYRLRVDEPPPQTDGGWANRTAPLKGVFAENDKNMVQLPDGKIFTGAELYNPSDGTWSLTAHPIAFGSGSGCTNVDFCGCGGPNGLSPSSICSFDSPSSMVMIAGSGPDADRLCTPRCGQVLVHHKELSQEGIELYNASGTAGDGGNVGSWSSARQNPVYFARTTRMVQINGSMAECRQLCGNVLITGIAKPPPGEGSGKPLAELYDPKSNTFTPVFISGVPTPEDSCEIYLPLVPNCVPPPPPSRSAPDGVQLLASLPRGQALVITSHVRDGQGGEKAPSAFVFDPLRGVNGAFTEVAPPPSEHSADSDEAAVLPDGSVMITSNDATHESLRTGNSERVGMDLFTPDPTGVGGTWGEKISGCGETPATPDGYWEKYCHILSMAPGGGVIAWTSAAGRGGVYGRVFDSDRPIRANDYSYVTSYEGRTYVFHPETKTWARSGDLINKTVPRAEPGHGSYNDMPTGGILVSGSCANCNKVLAVNYARSGKTLMAEMWQPIAPPRGLPVYPPFPPNDNFLEAQDISGLAGSVAGTNKRASLQLAEPLNGLASVWYRWTAPTGGPMTFDTFGSSFDTVLGVYTGDNVRRLTEVAKNDDALDVEQSLVAFVAIPGVVYHIAVGRNGKCLAREGDIKLNWGVSAP